ncbi:HSP90 family protein [Streptomyces mobaraensis NBRC 13819 = DSM 40847]|uniref:Heat shock protein 90 n=1 Tax=Streptomyces mobaraensis (strain ATCC 29032 / DSM 40847 / JCM 4168 / NBRC 13819 / NCIMB 11159 / IPCR 16-22) TaxID=1223523 RepID=M3A862_STRM1|nr:HSP90 family protein [Streptomyces mobaraensis]EMF01354.1 heat shock protein 90 [Streptomyces mobaraensis NBRC 13819 = DSM 40847]QTT77266.1 HSP90 family protein [Streptomyces mobaraensis NBRC 13819 = DSM 40847]
MTDDQIPHTFQVDLRGLVDLLSHHLYSSPKVYLRELLQNAVDAITARRAEQPGAPATVRLHADGGRLRVEDSGIGLTEADVHDLLATIGRSSKRDGLESARSEFLGQFGIGLLACFVVAEEIRVVSRSARTPGAPPVEWTARDDGSYTVRTLDDEARPEPGTTVYLAARRGSEDWLAEERVLALAKDFGSLLPHDVRVGDTPVTDRPPVWERAYPNPSARRVALARHCHELFGFSPLDAIELDVPVAGVRGVAYVLPQAVSPGRRGGHRVHLKGMLLTDRADELLPEWAFFVRCVVDTDSLRPTASRESLYDDDRLAAVREALGERIRDWLAELAAGDQERLRQFLSVHHVGVKSLARHDADMLRTMLPWLPFETSDGQLTLEEFAQRHRTVHFTRTVEEFRQVAPIAAAQGVGVVNGGYTFDGELVEMLPRVRPGTTVAELDAETVTAHLDHVEPGDELALADFLAAARARLDALGCDVVLRSFLPVTVPALHLDDRAARHERARAEEESKADDLWSSILGSLRDEAPRARLVLNHLSPLVRRVGALADRDRDLAGTAAEALYGQALLMAQRPLRPADSALLNRAFLGLLEWAAHPAAPSGPSEEGR